MDYNRIVAVTGMPGLYEVLSSKTDGAIVRSLEDGGTKFVSSRIHNLSHLESIEVYTVRDNVTLTDIFLAIRESKVGLPDLKDNKALKAYFEKVYPDLDFERVYTSDMKKMIKWYEVLNQNNVDFTAKPQEEEEKEEEVTVEETVTEEAKPKAKAKTATKTASAKTASPKKAKAEEAEKPKKAAPKKKAKE